MTRSVPIELTLAIAKFLADVAWPLIALAVLIVFRRQLQSLLTRLLRVSLKAGSVELATALEGHISADVLKSLDRASEALNLEPHKARVSVLVVDVKGFTGAEKLFEPSVLSSLLRDYLTLMTNTVFDLGGTVSRWEGYLLVAYWGAPISWPNSAERACLAAVGMRRVAENLSDTLRAGNMPPLRLRIGIATGEAIVGDLGPRQRFNYSILGEPVSMATRLSELSYQYSADVIITGDTYGELPARFVTESLGRITLKGRAEPVTIYALLSKEAASGATGGRA